MFINVLKNIIILNYFILCGPNGILHFGWDGLPNKKDIHIFQGRRMIA